MISVKRICKKMSDKEVLDDVSFEVNDGEIVGLVGPNGAGKTTLLNIIAGIWHADAGTVEIDRVDIHKGREALRSKIGFIPDVPYLYPKLTGREFLDFVGTLYGLDTNTIQQKIDYVEKALEISSWLDEIMESYPRGVRQKMTFAAMLLHSPRILLLDEPLTNLDPKSSRLVKEMMQKRAREGSAILLSTHILEVAEKLCHRIVVLHQGKKIAEGSLQSLKETAKTGQGSLEEIFLQLTGGEKVAELLKYIG